jgi:succinate dehydrogenase flavin-adding protein (antitoxin of CptAB toxin-antitoxin module)
LSPKEQKMKYLYIVDYWVPFPSSEYGGLINLIASNDTEAFTLLSNEEQFDDQYTERIMERVINAQKFALQDDYESGILEAFTT